MNPASTRLKPTEAIDWENGRLQPYLAKCCSFYAYWNGEGRKWISNQDMEDDSRLYDYNHTLPRHVLRGMINKTIHLAREAMQRGSFERTILIDSELWESREVKTVTQQYLPHDFQPGKGLTTPLIWLIKEIFKDGGIEVQYNEETLEQANRIHLRWSDADALETHIHIASRIPEQAYAGLSELRQQKILTDFTIVAQGEAFPVHKVVLAAKSPVFLAMFQNKERVDNVLDLSDAPKKIVAQLIDYLYTANIIIPRKLHDVAVLLGLSHQFAIDDLKNLCEDALWCMVSDETLLILYHYADKFSLNIVKKRCTHLCEEYHPALKTQILDITHFTREDYPCLLRYAEELKLTALAEHVKTLLP